MVEFRFDIKPLFPQPIVKITSNLLPHTFRGDRRMALDTTSKMSEIIDRLGELSATSQKLNKAVTTSQRLRMSDNQKIYLLADAEAGHNGAVIGLLKVGTKSLYLFDEFGETKKVDDAPCILDFYVHESRQRAGLGKDLFETMLAEENWTPIKLSVDRPSEKLLGFLKKHYGMEKTIPQSNNFVLYEGFFGPPGTENNNQQHANGLHITDSPNTALFGPHFIGDDNKKRIRHQDTPSPSTQITQISPVGRYAAPRPTCSMAEAAKKESEISLTPSQVSRMEKSNPKKNPLDAITKPPKVKEVQEKRSGLQNVREENLNTYFNNPFTQKHSGLSPPEQRSYNNNVGQQMQQQNMQQQNMQQQNMQQQNMPQHMQQQNMQQQNMQQQHMQQQNMQQQNMQQQNMQQQNMQQQNMQQQNMHQVDNVGNVGGRAPLEMDNKAPPSEPKYDENAGNIIHSTTKPSTGEASSKVNEADDAVKHEIIIDSVCEDLRTLQTSQSEQDIEKENNLEATDEAKLVIQEENINNISPNLANDEPKIEADAVADNFSQPKKPTSFQLSKQHTGLKNISFNVGMAVTPTNKMEFDQEQTDEFGIVKINRPPGKLVSPPPPDNSDAMSTVSSGEGFTDQGYYDLKFYHNKLW